MHTLSLSDLPTPPTGKVGWPWDEGSPAAPEKMGEWPRISIVTPSFNQGEFLEEAIRSVLLQGYPNLEYFVIDGGSTDESAAIIERYAPWLSYWASEPDEGQADAIDKGFGRARGDLLAWINADDLYLPGAFGIAGEAYASQPGAMVAGDVVNLYHSTRQEFLWPQRGITLANAVKKWEGERKWHQPGLFFPAEAVRRVGGVDASLRYAMDYDLICKLMADGVAVTYLNRPVAKFRLHEESKTATQNDQMYAESRQVSQRYWTLVDAPEDAAERLRAWHLGSVALNEIAQGQRDLAKGKLAEAIALDPEAWGNAEKLVRKLSHELLATALLVNADVDVVVARVQEALELIGELVPGMAAHEGRVWGKVYGGLGFANYRVGKLRQARACFLRGVRYDGSLILNVGVWSIYIESLLGRRLTGWLRGLFREARKLFTPA